MREPYVPLFCSIINSTLWARESSDTRVVFITLLAMMDPEGCVASSLPGIARNARVPEDVVRDALQRLEAPDPDSRSPQFEGRRIERVRRGWRVLNAEDFRELARREAAKARKREWWRRNRGKSTRPQLDELEQSLDAPKPKPKPKTKPRKEQTPHTPQGGAVSTHSEKTSAATTATEPVTTSPAPKPADPVAADGGIVDLPLAERARRYLADPMGERFTLGDAAGWPEIQAVMAVWASEWRPTTLRGGLTDPRLRAILARLSEGYTPEQLGEAIKGSRLDDWLKQNRKLQTPATVLASSDAVDKYAGLLDTKPVVELTGLARAHHEALEGKRGELAQQIARKHTDPHEWHYEFEEAKREVGT